jgi:hypothetical protein
MGQVLKYQFLQIRPDVQDIQPYLMRTALNSAVAAMGSGLSPVALMVVLAVVFVPAGHFLFLCLLLLLGILVHRRRFRLLLLRIEVLVLLCHINLLTRVMCDSAQKPVPAEL